MHASPTPETLVERVPRGACRPDRDRLLQLSRRVDWRFLLPDPRPERVALMGPADDELAESLTRFVGEWEPASARARYDLVVVAGRAPEWSAIHSVLAPGGWTFVEAKAGPLGPGLARVRARAERAGLRDVTFHWHRPSFRACLEIVPMEDAGVTGWTLGRGPQNARAALRLFVLRAARAVGALSLAYRSYSVLARRPEGVA